MPNHENDVNLKPFASTRLTAVLQAVPVSELVTEEAYWLKGEQPGTVHRYEAPRRAYHSIQRLGSAEELDAYIIQNRHAAAIGLATVIRNQHVIHPQEGRIEGDDIDYWLKAGSVFDLHNAVVGRLRERQGSRATFATVVIGSMQEPAKTAGFGQYMEYVGEPAILGNDTDDHYGVTRNGAAAQVYRLVQP